MGIFRQLHLFQLLLAGIGFAFVFITYHAQALDTNLVQNPSLQTVSSTNSSLPAGWYKGGWGTNVANLEYPVSGNGDSTAVRTTITSYSSGDAKWYFQPVNVSPSTHYTYQDYYRSNVATTLVAAYLDSSGNATYQTLGAAAASATWQPVSLDVSTPANATQLTVYHLVNAVGWLEQDDVSVTAIVPAPTPTPTDPSMVANPSLQAVSSSNPSLPASWQHGSWGTNAASFDYPVNGHTDTYAIRTTMSSYTSGDAKWYFDPITASPNTQYTFQDYYRSNVSTSVVAEFLDTVGTPSYLYLGSAPATSSWQSLSFNFSTPATTSQLTIFHLLDSAGWLEQDDVSVIAAVQPPPPPVTANPIVNPSLENTSGGNPIGWQPSNWGINTPKYTYSSDAHTGQKSVRVDVSGYASGDAKWYFNPVTTLTPNSDYLFTAWYKSNAQPRVVAAYGMPNGATQYVEMPNLKNPSTASWQQYSAVMTPPKGAMNATVYILLSMNGWVETDDYDIEPYVPVGFNAGIVSLTFDDGWQSTYTNGLPLLKKYSQPSTQYLVSGLLNTSGYMTTKQAKAFLAQGSEIGSHTVHHYNLTTLSATQLKAELADSQVALRTLFGSTVATDFASPYGAYNDSVVAAIKQYYNSHRSVDVGFNSKDNFDPYNILVQDVDISTTSAQVQAWVDKAKAQKTWLVLVYHNVEKRPAASDTYAVSTANLDRELSYIKSSGISVQTMQQALNTITPQLP